MALADTFELVHDMTQRGKNILSVYHLLRANSGEDAAAMSDAFQNSILPVLRLQQSSPVINNEVRVFNLGDPLDFKTTTLGAAPGLRVGADSPTFIGGAVRFPSLNRDIRAGQKRFPGMEETDYTGGSLVAAANTLLENNADAMLANWLASSDSHHVANYIVIKRVCKTEDPVTGRCLVYRLPETDGELVFFQPTARVVNQEISSQVSRKVF